MNIHARHALGLVALATSLVCQQAVAQNAASGLAGAVQKSLSTNPVVTERLNAFKAAVNEIDIAKGGLLPQVNLTADVGRESNKFNNRLEERERFNRSGVGLSLSQVIWDGQSIRSEVERLDHARQSRYFDFVAASEDTALEATKAYVDVLRLRRLVALAEDNYVQHKHAADLLGARAKSGVGRGVDSEQAQARLALAEINLNTELTNLYDVSARYLRVVGETPAASLSNADKLSGAAPTGQEAITRALARSAAITASIENLRAVQAQATNARSGFQPKVEARLRGTQGNNIIGNVGQKQEGVGEIVMNWNLFSGGSDQARVRRAADLINAAADQRDKVCREVRLTAAVASKDIVKSKDELEAMRRNIASIRNARDAYRQQFEIGQRSLLDLLNSENEVYTAERAYANAQHDALVANARVLAAGNSLISTLGLTRADGAEGDSADNLQMSDNASERCPTGDFTVASTSKADLDARAKAMTTAVAAPAPAEVPAPRPAADGSAAQTVEQRLVEWAEAWAAKDFERYIAFYAKDFSPDRSSPEQWRAKRIERLSKPQQISLNIANIKTAVKGKNVVTSFHQKYESELFKDNTAKTLTWRQVDGQWLIVKESNR